jgi:hypothetical protein
MIYKLIKSRYPGLEQEVNNHLEFGWELYGNPFEANGYYCQAMIRKLT